MANASNMEQFVPQLEYRSDDDDDDEEEEEEGGSPLTEKERKRRRRQADRDDSPEPDIYNMQASAVAVRTPGT